MENKTTLKENEELNKYIVELNDDLNLTIGNLKEKSLMISTIRSKWLSYLFKEKENLSRIKDAKTKIITSKANEKSINSSVLRLKNEDNVSQNDETVKKLAKMQKITESNIDFIERAMNILNDFVWQIKNSVEILKLTTI